MALTGLVHVTSADELAVGGGAAAWLCEADFPLFRARGAAGAQQQTQQQQQQQQQQQAGGAGDDLAQHTQHTPPPLQPQQQQQPEQQACASRGAADADAGALPEQEGAAVVFEARALSDVTVLLSERPGATHYRHNTGADPGAHYTCIFGSHRNSKFVLERNGAAVAERRDEPRGAVSPERFSYFWVAILRSGMVAAGCGPTPGVGQFLEWVDPAPLGSKLRHVALTSWDSEVLYRAIDVRSVSARELREASRGEVSRGDEARGEVRRAEWRALAGQQASTSGRSAASSGGKAQAAQAAQGGKACPYPSNHGNADGPCDALIEPACGEPVPARRAPLMAHSAYFRSAFQAASCWAEGVPHAVVRSVFSRQAVAAAVCFAHDPALWGGHGNGKEHGDLELLVELLELSDYYGMPLLQSSAAARVLTLVRPWNVCGVLGALQGLPSCGPLAAALERYAARRIRAVVSQSSGELVALSPGAIEGMLRGGDRWLPPTSEDSVCDALTAWVGDDEARATFADCRLVQLVRFASLSDACLQRALRSGLHARSAAMRARLAEGVAACSERGSAERGWQAARRTPSRDGASLRWDAASRQLSKTGRVPPPREPGRAGVPLRFVHHGDANGVMGYLASRSSFNLNPVAAGLVRTMASSCKTSLSDSAALVARRGPPRRFNAFGGTTPWCLVDLGPSGCLIPKHYTLRHDQSDNYLREWTLEGSQDGVSWHLLSTHVDEGPKGRHEWGGWPLCGANARRPYSSFRVVLGSGSRATATGQRVLCLSELEFYGHFVGKHQLEPPAEADETDGEELEEMAMLLHACVTR